MNKEKLEEMKKTVDGWNEDRDTCCLKIGYNEALDDVKELLDEGLQE